MDEKLVKQITNKVMETLQDGGNSEANAIPIGISARHIHMTQEHVDALFGEGHKLTVKKDLIGGEYACEECVTIVGEKLKAIENVRVLGPVRKASQLEISKTDAIKLGVNAPYRESGDLKDSAAISIVGPRGTIYLKEGCIIAKRHIHMTPSDAEKLGVTDKQLVSVRFGGERGGTLSDVKCRVLDTYSLEMHIDTDEANCMGATPKTVAYLVKE